MLTESQRTLIASSCIRRAYLMQDIRVDQYEATIDFILRNAHMQKTCQPLSKGCMKKFYTYNPDEEKMVNAYLLKKHDYEDAFDYAQLCLKTLEVNMDYQFSLLMRDIPNIHLVHHD